MLCLSLGGQAGIPLKILLPQWALGKSPQFLTLSVLHCVILYYIAQFTVPGPVNIYWKAKTMSTVNRYCNNKQVFDALKGLCHEMNIVFEGL